MKNTTISSSLPREKKNEWLLYLSIATICFALTAYFHRNIIFNSALVGDSGDARLCNLIVEHWYRVFQGKESMADLGMFYPFTNSLSYSDAMLGYVFTYVPLRLLGVNMWYSYKITLIVYHFIGLYFTFLFCYRKLHMSFLSCLIPVMIALLSNQWAYGHTQLYTFFLLPLLIWFVWSFFERINSSLGKRIFHGVLSITLFSLIMYTAVYIGYFVILFGVVLCLFGWIICVFRRKKIIMPIIHYVRSHLLECIFYAVYAVVLMVPFALLYVPASKQFGNRTWDEISPYLVLLQNLFVMKPSNFLYGRLAEGKSINGELMRGYPLFTFFAFVFSACSLLWQKKRTRMYSFFSAIALACVFCTLLLIKIDDKSLWRIVYASIPGIGSTRAVARNMQFLMFPIGLVIGYAIDRLIQPLILNTQAKTAVTSLLCFIFFLETIFIGGMYSSHTRDDYRSIETFTSPAPADCAAMYIQQDENFPYTGIYGNHHDIQLSAWMIAMQNDIKTINGYSGQLPEKAWGFFNIESPDYPAAIDTWIDYYGLTNVYAYSLLTNEWVPHER